MLDNVGSGQIVSQTPAWYRQFWPWFLIILPATVVVAGFFTLYLAIKYSDDLVSDNYYRDGLAINQRLSQDLRATELGLSAKLNFDVNDDATNKVLGLTLDSEQKAFLAPDVLTLLLLHPTDARADHRVKLVAAGGGRYRGQFPELSLQRFYLRLIPGLVTEQNTLQNITWRLNGEIDFSVSQIAELQAEPQSHSQSNRGRTSTNTANATSTQTTAQDDR